MAEFSVLAAFKRSTERLDNRHYRYPDFIPLKLIRHLDCICEFALCIYY